MEYPVCFSMESITPGFPFSFAYDSPELSTTVMSATSDIWIMSTPSMPRSISTISFKASTLSTASPTRTINRSPSSVMYPAGMEKFCAVRIFVKVSIVRMLFKSAAS